MKVLFRKSLGEQDEFDVARQYFDVIEYRAEIKPGDFIIPRYSSLPYYNELEEDVKRLGGTLINSYEQHKWIANFEWYAELRRYTFDSWDMHTIAKAPPDIRYVVKGKTNSKKWQWNTRMFAKNKDMAVRIGCDLYNDSMIGSQGIIYRRYEPLKLIETGINGMPFSNEYRFFFYKEELLGSSFYWAIADEIPKGVPTSATELAKKVAKTAAKFTNFYVLDIAEREDGTWVLVEVNCGTMSGLSLIEPDTLYKNLKLAVLST